MSSSSLAPEVVAPAHLSVPEHDDSFGDEAADLVGLFGLHVDEAQRLALRAMLSTTADGRWAALESAIIVGRQNGKTIGVLLPIALHAAMRTPDRMIVWSAHLYRTAAEGFRKLDQMRSVDPELKRWIPRVVRSKGEEEFEFRNGSRIIFVSRSRQQGRGLSGDVVILDEALFLDGAAMAALFPLMSARQNPLLVYASSAGLPESNVLREIRDRGRRGGDPSLAYVEWCGPPEGSCETPGCEHAKDAAGCMLDDPANWRAGNPAARVTMDYVAKERRAMPPLEFARERMGWWDDPGTADQFVTVVEWDSLTGNASPSSPLVLGVDAAPGHVSSSIVATDGRDCELLERRPGVAWLAPRLVELAARHDVTAIAYDPAGPIGSLVPELEAAGLELTEVKGPDSVRACGSLVRAVKEASIRHRGEPEFAAAVAGARRRAVGDGHKWSRRDSTVDITPLVALTVGLWAATSMAERPSVYESERGLLVL